MANILLTQSCIRSCPYCFAKKEMAGGGTMGWENLIYAADFLQRSGEHNVSLLGGEPTLHPDFVDMVLYLLERGFGITVFTSGVMSPRQLSLLERHLADVRIDRLQFVCNLNDPAAEPVPAKETEALQRFLAAMGHLTRPGFNIYRTDFSLEFLFETVVRYGLDRSLRLGLAHPIPGQANAHVPADQVGQAMERLYSFRAGFEALRMRIVLDCGFPLCKVSDECLGWLYRQSGEHANFRCGIALDIKPDMSVYACFPLAEYHRKSIFDFDTVGEISAWYNDRKQAVRTELPGVFTECDGCMHKDSGMCDGGGVCHLVDRLSKDAFIRLPEVRDGLAHLDGTA